MLHRLGGHLLLRGLRRGYAGVHPGHDPHRGLYPEGRGPGDGDEGGLHGDGGEGVENQKTRKPENKIKKNKNPQNKRQKNKNHKKRTKNFFCRWDIPSYGDVYVQQADVQQARKN